MAFDDLRKRYPDVFNKPKPSEKAAAVPPKLETAICRDCKQPYQKTIHCVLGAIFEFSHGRCPACNQNIREAEAVKSEERRQAAILKQKNDWLRSCGIPRDYLLKGFENYDHKLQTVAFNKCKGYAEKYPIADSRGYASLFLFSDQSWGTGKTHLACAIARRILQRWTGEGTDWNKETSQLDCIKRNPIHFVSEPDMFNSIRATYDYTLEEKKYRPSEAAIMNVLTTAPLLIVDDVGKQEVSDMRFVQRTLFTIIDARYRSGLPIVLTANLSAKGLAVHLGGGVGNEASMSRLKAMLRGNSLNMAGADYREKWQEKRSN
jgi:DNA replication protein DnaC